MFFDYTSLGYQRRSLPRDDWVLYFRIEVCGENGNSERERNRYMGMEKNGNDNRGKFPDNMFQSCVTIRSLCVQSVAFRVSYRLFSAISIIFGANFIYLQGGPENSTNRYFATICSRITQFRQILRKKSLSTIFVSVG